jgi:PleD family two-component response regulator
MNPLPESPNVKCNCPEILIVDDEVFNIMALKQAVKKYNFKIDSAENGIVGVSKV